MSFRVISETVNVKKMRPFLFGENWKGETPSVGLNLNEIDSRFLFLSLDSERILETVQNIPHRRTLDNAAIVNFSENDRIYDTAFLLPILCDSLRPSVAVDMIQLLKSGVV